MVATTTASSGPAACGPNSSKAASSKGTTLWPSASASAARVRATGLDPAISIRGATPTGSTNTSSPPPDGQVDTASTTPGGGSAAASSAAGVMRTSRGRPSARAASASRTTIGSEQAPPTPPLSRPSAVTTALSPTRADTGGSTRTTVATTCGLDPGSRPPVPVTSGRGLPLLVLDRRPDFVAGQRHVDVGDAERLQRVEHRVDIGGGGADRGGLADALGTDRVVRRGRDGLIGLEPRRLPAGGQQVVGEVLADAVALLVEGDQLHRGDAVALGEAAVDLALHDHRVDAHATVVDRDHLADLPLAGAPVDVHDHAVGAERVGHVRRVVVGDPLKARLHAFGQVGVGGEGDVLDGLGTIRRATDREAALGVLDVLLGDLQQVRGDLGGLVAELAGDHGGGRAADGGGAGGVGAKPIGGVVSVTLDHGDVLGLDAELPGDDLREGGLVALALALDAELEDRLAGGVHAQLRRVEHAQPGDVVLRAVAGADHLSEAGDADPHQLATGAALGLLAAQLLVAELLQRQVQRAAVVAGVVDPADRGVVGELLWLDEVVAPEVGRVDAQLGGGLLHQPLDQETRLGDPERAAIGDPAGGLVGVDAVHLAPGGRHVVGAGEDVEQPGGEFARLRGGVEGAMVGDHPGAQPEDPAVRVERHLAVHVVVAGEAGGDQVAGAILDPLHRPAEQQRRDRGDHVTRVDRHLVAEAAAKVRRDDADVLLRQAGDQREQGAVRVRRLRGHPDGRLAGGGVDVG